jgi:glycosyltransferase involved in cell wall biosynthesis
MVSGGSGVAVVIPAYQAREHIARALDSALAQTLAPSEVVLVDDESPDGTADFVERRYGARVRVIRARCGGAAAARNAGWRAARSAWVAFLDADDEWMPDKLERAFALLERFPAAGWFFSDGTFEPEDGPCLESWFAQYVSCPPEYFGSPLAALIEVNFIMTHAVVVRRALLQELNGFDEGLSHAEDLDLWIRLARRAPAAALARPLVRYHRRGGGLSSAVEARLRGDVRVFERLAADADLAAPLRRRAAARARTVHFKLAFAALREGRGREARAHLASAWHVPERMWPVAWAWLASFAPAALRRQARRWEGGKRHLARPALDLRRPLLVSERPPGAAGGGT